MLTMPICKESSMKKYPAALLILILFAAFCCIAAPTEKELEQDFAKNNPSSEEVLKSLPDEFFPFIMFYGDGCFLTKISKYMNEPYALRREKLFHQFARWNINTIVPSNAKYRNDDYAKAREYGLKVIHACNILHGISEADRTSGAEEPLKMVKDIWNEEVRLVRNNENLLAYHVYDEPHPLYCKSIAIMMDYIQSLDPSKPIIFTQQNMPVGSFVPEWEALSKCKVIFSDQYNVSAAFGRNPWSYREAIPEFSKPNHSAHHWPIIQAFAYNIQPTPAEFRIMAWNALAAGAKGLGLYTTGALSTTWPLPEGEMYAAYPATGDACFGDDPIAEEITRLGRLLTTAGWLLVPLKYDSEYPWSVLNGEMIDTSKCVGKTFPNYSKGRERPVIEVSAFTGKDYDILVIHNNDPSLFRTGIVNLSESSERKVLLDLRSLEPAPEKDGGFQVNFICGDGSLFAYGTAESLLPVKEKVLRKRFDADKLKLELDMAVAKAYGVEIEPVEALIATAEKYAANDLPELMLVARKMLLKAEFANADFATISAAIESARKSFSAIDYRLRHLAVETRTSFETLPDPIQKIILDTMELTRQFSAVENSFRQGKCTPQAAAELLQKCRLMENMDFNL